MDRYEVMAGKMAPLTDGAHRKWGFTGKVETRSYERLVDTLIDFVETGDGLKARFLTGFAACLAADRKSVENRGFGVAVRKVQCHRGEDGTVRVSSVETMHERRYTVDDWRYDTAHCEQTETTGLHPNGSDPDEILTISIIGRDGSVLLDERFRPTVKTEWPHASAVNGIYPEDVADLPTIETAIPRLREIFAGADEVIGYNVGFDLGFLSVVGVRPREDARITDTMNLFTWFMGRRYKLVDAADHIGYEWTGRAHGSLADALATLAVQRWLEQWLVAE
ncbi:MULTISPECIES: 3'-5' exonuclease [Bacillati]|uniref:3'-5' exonuclease n=1 Tax=Bacillati TaxID=1783272 RepID=UPI0018976751|nr:MULTISPECIES: 3'-5' exonuclease [Terrabacteria group]